jgi:hypothetical protein
MKTYNSLPEEIKHRGRVFSLLSEKFSHTIRMVKISGTRYRTIQVQTKQEKKPTEYIFIEKTKIQ